MVLCICGALLHTACKGCLGSDIYVRDSSLVHNSENNDVLCLPFHASLLQGSCRAGFCPGISKGMYLVVVLALRGDLFDPGLPLDTGVSVVRSEIMEIPRCKRSNVAKLCISGRRREKKMSCRILNSTEYLDGCAVSEEKRSAHRT